METISLTKEELQDFYNKYSPCELENINGLFEYASFDFDLKEARKILKQIQLEKENNKEENTLDNNYKIKQLNEKELEFFHDIVEAANFCFSSVTGIDYSKERMASNYLLTSIEKEQLSRKIENAKEDPTRLKHFNLNETQLRKFFNKYNPIELEEINNLFEYVFDYEKETEVSILKEVHDEKIKEAAKSYEVYVKPTNYKTSNLREKNIELSKKELLFLLNITLSHFDGVMSERDIQIEDYIEDINLLIDSINTELVKKEEKRKEKIKK